MTTPFLKVLNATSQMAQSFQVKQWWLFRCKRLSSRCIASPAGRNGSVVAVEVSNDQVGIRTATNTDDIHLLAAERMRGMSDGHPSPNSWGRWGSVLWGCRPGQINWFKKSSGSSLRHFMNPNSPPAVMGSGQTVGVTAHSPPLIGPGRGPNGFLKEIFEAVLIRSIMIFSWKFSERKSKTIASSDSSKTCSRRDIVKSGTIAQR